MTPQQVAAEWAALFETKTRADGSTFVSLSLDNFLDHPLQHAVRRAHDGRMPDDHIYSACEDACITLAEADDLDDVRLEADPYYANILAWLASHLGNIDYLSQAVTELGARDGHTMLTYAHDIFRNDVLASVKDSVVTEANHRNEAAEPGAAHE